MRDFVNVTRGLSKVWAEVTKPAWIETVNKLP